MIITKIINDHYMIGFSLHGRSECEYCVFAENFLPVPVINNMRSLSVFSHSKPLKFHLTKEQEQVTQGIFDKMKEENTSDQPRSTGLQKTYLLELLHVIVKLSFTPA